MVISEYRMELSVSTESNWNLVDCQLTKAADTKSTCTSAWPHSPLLETVLETAEWWKKLFDDDRGTLCLLYGTWYFRNPGGIDINDEVKDKTGAVILSKLSYSVSPLQSSRYHCCQKGRSRRRFWRRRSWRERELATDNRSEIFLI